MQSESIQLLKKGNRQAFRKIFDQYHDALCSFGYRYIPDISEIEDLIQEVFISLWEKRKDFNHINAIKSFLYTSVRNKCLNNLKHKLVRQNHESALIYELESDHSFSNHIIEEESFNRLYSEISHLPESAQKIMLLVLKGLKNREIAAELGISENTVKTQKKISYSKLKTKLGPGLMAIFLNL